VVIIGSGLSAEACAAELQRRGSSVVLCSAAGPADLPLAVWSTGTSGAQAELRETSARWWREEGKEAFAVRGALRLASESDHSPAHEAALQSLSRDELRTRFRFLDLLPSGCEGRLDGAGGCVSAGTASELLRARLLRAGGRLAEARVEELEDTGELFRLKLSGAAGERLVECEQVMLVPASAAEAAELLALLRCTLRLPRSQSVMSRCRPRALHENYAASPVLEFLASALRMQDDEPPDTDLRMLLCPEEETGAMLFQLACRDAALAAAVPASARVARASAALIRTVAQLAPPPTWGRLPGIIHAPDGLPFCTLVPGLEAGRAAFVSGDPALAPALATLVCDLLRRVAPGDLLLSVCATRPGVKEAVEAQEAADAAAAAAAAAAEPEERAAARSSFEGGRQRERGTSNSDEFELAPRAARSLS